jgi:hypothetical protein
MRREPLLTAHIVTHLKPALEWLGRPIISAPFQPCARFTTCQLEANDTIG